MITFIDKFLSFDLDTLPEDKRAFHIHKHMKNYCKANTESACRFEFPKAPMTNTKILTPLRKANILRGKVTGEVGGRARKMANVDLDGAQLL
jgi:hypothetical protein